MPDCLLPTFNVLTNTQIQKINENSLILKYQKGDIICRQNHPVSHVLFLKSGLIKLHKNYTRDKSAIIGIVGQNKFFAMTGVFTNRIFQLSASAIEDCEVINTNFDIFIDILFRNGKYACRLMDQISSYTLLLMDKMIMNTHKQIPGRMAEVLMFFAREVYNSDSYTLPLSRQDIAIFISATKETVSRTLTEFKNDRLIEIDDKLISIISPELIEKLSKIG